MNLNSSIYAAFVAIVQSEDYSDAKTIGCFKDVVNSIIENPKEILSCDIQKLSIVLSTIASSSFYNRFPTFNGYKTGMIVSAMGYYSFMTQLGTSMPNKFIPAFVVLLHNGRPFISDLFEKALFPQSQSFSSFSFFDMADSIEINWKKTSIAKAFELRMINYSQKVGFCDENLKIFEREINQDQRAIEMYEDDEDPFNKGLKLYNWLKAKINSYDPLDFAEID